MRGMPQVYSGDEIAMSGGEDPDNRRDFPGGWPDSTSDSSQNAFTNRTPQQAEMHDWVQQLLTLRTKYPALQSGEMQVLQADKDTLAYVRVFTEKAGGQSNSGSKVIVVVNRSATALTTNIKLEGTLLSGTHQPHTIAGNAVTRWESNQLHIEIPGSSVWIAAIGQ
jgi:glycosidase